MDQRNSQFINHNSKLPSGFLFLCFIITTGDFLCLCFPRLCSTNNIPTQYRHKKTSERNSERSGMVLFAAGSVSL